MIARVIRSRASVPHDIIQVEMGTVPKIIQVPISNNLGVPLRTVLKSPKQLAEHGDIHCWYVETQ